MWLIEELTCGGMVEQVQEAFGETMTSVVSLCVRYPIACANSIGLLCTIPYTRWLHRCSSLWLGEAVMSRGEYSSHLSPPLSSNYRREGATAVSHQRAGYIRRRKTRLQRRMIAVYWFLDSWITCSAPGRKSLVRSCISSACRPALHLAHAPSLDQYPRSFSYSLPSWTASSSWISPRLTPPPNHNFTSAQRRFRILQPAGLQCALSFPV